MIFDSHAHYDDEQFDEDRDILLSGMEEAGIGGIINMGASLEGVAASQALAEQYPFVYAAAGVHPDHTGSLNEENMQWMYGLCRKLKTVAVGEIGLDYYWDKESRDCQKKWFITQLDMAKETGLPVNIHSRDAAQETFEIMKKEHAGTRSQHRRFQYSIQASHIRVPSAPTKKNNGSHRLSCRHVLFS